MTATISRSHILKPFLSAGLKGTIAALLMVVSSLTAVSPKALALPPGKVGYRLNPSPAPDDKDEKMAKGSFMVASQCETCNKGYTLGMLKFFGFDKRQPSAQESFFITNNTDRRLRGVALYVNYVSPADGRQLHKRYLKLHCDIPAGETRKADIKSFDVQKSFYYVKSDGPRRGGVPFEVEFDLVSYWLEQ